MNTLLPPRPEPGAAHYHSSIFHSWSRLRLDGGRILARFEFLNSTAGRGSGEAL
jgi:hypothetical protein